MSVFKLGKRVGLFDISGGISRGDFESSAYHKTDRDPRIKQRANTDNTIGRFRSAMNAAEGYARPSRFAIRVFPPRKLDEIIKTSNSATYLNGEIGYNIKYKTKRTQDRLGVQTVSAKYMNDLTQSYGRQVNIHCDNITMPAKKMTTQDVQYGSEPVRSMITGHEFPGTITASFYADKYLRERQFMEAWQKMCVGEHTHKAQYYDDYIGKLQIYQLGADNERFSRDRPTYAVEVMEVYPQEVGSIEYGYGKKNEIVKINIEFGYKYWRNMGSETSSLSFGDHLQTPADVKSANNGLFGMLPPVLQRVGKSVLGQARTVLNPVGRLSKGRIFTPFF